MHPAYSVIFFTTASGAGYGLLVWLALASIFKSVPSHWAFGLIGLGIALVLITAGLLSSTAHLGRPERAWRAFSQWKSSWLSREGVAAVATYIPAGIIGIYWVFFEDIGGALAPVAILTAVLALITVYCTGMIYASLPTIKAWYQPLTAPNYLAMSVASGGVLFVFVLSIFRALPAWAIVIGIIALAAAWLLKLDYWKSIDNEEKAITAGDATGLGRFGEVTTLEPPHTQANFVMREMGFQVGRKHARKLRNLSVYLAFFVPMVCLALLLIASTATATFFALVGVVAMGVGLVIERWLFFAEARHVVTLYYGQQAA